METLKKSSMIFFRDEKRKVRFSFFCILQSLAAIKECRYLPVAQKPPTYIRGS